MVKLLSVVVSVYNEELALREFYQETGAVLKALPSSWDYELLFVNDGSADRSLEILRELARRDDRVRVCLLYTSPSPRDRSVSRMPSSA